MRVGIFGAGLIGGYVGGALAAAGAAVSLIGRGVMLDGFRLNGVRVIDLAGRERTAGPNLTLSETPAALADCDLVLLTVKRGATANVAASIRAHVPDSTPVICLQNGIGAAAALRALLPGHRVFGAMVPFNVVKDGAALRRASGGDLAVEAEACIAPFRGAFAAAGLKLDERADFDALSWGKLLLNLNNPVNALADLPLREQLSQRGYRRCVALLIGEALAVLTAANIKPARATPLPSRWLPTLLNLPNPVFKVLAARMLKIDPRARSSMWEDLTAGRPTEIDFLCGEVVALATTLGATAPRNARMVKLIREAEQGGQRRFDADALARALVD
jgi:2-dehydropantoate 2-reductase